MAEEREDVGGFALHLAGSRDNILFSVDHLLEVAQRMGVDVQFVLKPAGDRVALKVVVHGSATQVEEFTTAIEKLTRRLVQNVPVQKVSLPAPIATLALAALATLAATAASAASAPPVPPAASAPPASTVPPAASAASTAANHTRNETTTTPPPTAGAYVHGPEPHPQLQHAERLFHQGFLEEARTQILEFQRAVPQRQHDMDAAVLKMWLLCEQPVEELRTFQVDFMSSMMLAKRMFGVGSERFGKFLHAYLNFCRRSELFDEASHCCKHFLGQEGVSENTRMVLRVYDAILRAPERPERDSEETWEQLARDARSADGKLRTLLYRHRIAHYLQRILQRTQPHSSPEQQPDIRQLLLCHERLLALSTELYGENVPATQKILADMGVAQCSSHQYESGCEHLRRAIRNLRGSAYIPADMFEYYEHVLRESEEILRRRAASN